MYDSQDMTPEPRIRVLPSELADQIAAGEVVERPASVVKELMENALDAGARRLDVTVEGGGRIMIRVVDDGGGMTAEEAGLSVLRHATSKISRPEDLWGLQTFGFRGEALPSIAAVSRMSIMTKVHGALVGHRLDMEAGRQVGMREVGIPEGTQIEVRDLFFNTPARLKFLKVEATESANVSEAVLRLALANPDVHMKLRLQDRVALDLPPARDLGARVRAALARRGASTLHEARGEENGVRVHAFIGAPEEAASNPRNTFLFVGKRFVRDRALLQSLCMAYGELLEKGRYPLAALFLQIEGDELDVNVHPQKMEVRFARAQEVYGAVRHVVGAAIARAPWLVAAQLKTYSLPPEAPAGDASLDADRGRPESKPPQQPKLWEPSARGAIGIDRGAWATGVRDGGGTASNAIPAAETGYEAPPQKRGFFADLVYVGQVHRTYLLCEGAGEMVLIDQHAAHERVAFQKLRTAHARRQVARQQLLFPLRVEVGEAATALMRDVGRAEVLRGFGYDVEVFGPGELLLRAVPEACKDADPKPVLVDLLADLSEGGTGAVAEERVDHMLATMACHSVVRAGDVLGREQVQALLYELDGVDLKSHCPHGRPVLLRLPLGEIERRFGRT